MPNTAINKVKLSNHWAYSKKIYIFGLLLAVGLASLVYSMTRPTTPGEFLTGIALVDSYCDTSKLDDTIPGFLAKCQAKDSELQEVSFLNIAFSGDAQNDTYGYQAWYVQLAAGDNDIFIQNKDLTDSLINMGYFVPLESMEGFDEFTKAHPDVELYWAEEPSREEEAIEEEEEEDSSRPMHVYAFDVSGMRAMIEKGAYDVRGKYAGLLVNSTNGGTSFDVLCEMLDYYKGSAAQ